MMQAIAPIVSLFLLLNLAQPITETEKISQLLYDELGVIAYIPETDYPISHINIEHRMTFENEEIKRGEPYQAHIEYKLELGERLDEEFKQIWQEEWPLMETVYGDLYMGKTAINLTVAPGGAGTLIDAEIIEIAGHHVQYQYLEREGDQFVIMIINFDDVGYYIEYLVQTETIEEEAKAFAKKIIDVHLQQ